MSRFEEWANLGMDIQDCNWTKRKVAKESWSASQASILSLIDGMGEEIAETLCRVDRETAEDCDLPICPSKRQTIAIQKLLKAKIEGA